jgi:PAS domain S-box-containing protein
MDRKHGEAERGWLDERYRQVIEQVEDYAIFTLDEAGLVSTWNRGAERVLGYLEEEVLGEPGAFIFTPEDREQGAPEHELATARREGKAEDVRWHLRKDGGRFWASGVLTALYDREGKLDGFAKILRDLTRQREAQEERERLLAELTALTETLEQRVETRTRALRQSERRFAQAFHAGPVAACLSTLGEEHFLEVNDAFVALSGFRRDELVGRSHKVLGMWSSPRDLTKLARLGEENFRDQELTLRTKAGETRNILLSREIIELDGERVNLKQFYDITERKETETHLLYALQRVMSDTSWFAQKVMEELAQVRVGNLEPNPGVALSKREREVLERLARGAGNDAIAAELGIAAQTVRNYISAVYGKLGVASRAEAIVWARERGIV